MKGGRRKRKMRGKKYLTTFSFATQTSSFFLSNVTIWRKIHQRERERERDKHRRIILTFTKLEREK